MYPWPSVALRGGGQNSWRKVLHIFLFVAQKSFTNSKIYYSPIKIFVNKKIYFTMKLISIAVNPFLWIFSITGGA